MGRGIVEVPRTRNPYPYLHWRQTNGSGSQARYEDLRHGTRTLGTVRGPWARRRTADTRTLVLSPPLINALKSSRPDAVSIAVSIDASILIERTLWTWSGRFHRCAIKRLQDAPQQERDENHGMRIMK